VIPLHQRLWSADAPDFKRSENTQLLTVVDAIKRAAGGGGVYVLDRGGDRGELINPLLNKKLRFIICLVGDRDSVFRGRYRQAMDASRRCPMSSAETVRFIKQTYHLEDIRVLDHERLKNLVALVVAAAYFSAVWLCETLKLKVLSAQVAKRFFGVPDFHYHALDDGIAMLLSRPGRCVKESRASKSTANQAQGMLFAFP
jgi:hypothetical protein